MHGTVDLAQNAGLEEARERAFSLPLEKFNPGDPELFRSDTHWPYFDRLRKEEPVHYCKDSIFGPYWSVTRYNDIMAVDTNHGAFSSAAALGGITIRDIPPDLRRESFIAMDRLRAHSPSAENIGERDLLGVQYGGTNQKDFGGVSVTGWRIIGGYAVQFDFSDGHNTGLYPFDYLRTLGQVAQLSEGPQVVAEVPVAGDRRRSWRRRRRPRAGSAGRSQCSSNRPAA